MSPTLTLASATNPNWEQEKQVTPLYVQFEGEVRTFLAVCDARRSAGSKCFDDDAVRVEKERNIARPVFLTIGEERFILRSELWGELIEGYLVPDAVVKVGWE